MTYEHLNRWTLPPCYVGAEWPDYYVFLGQHRDSDALTRSNFQTGLEQLGGETETVRVINESHWAVGWVEWIAIHESDTDALEKADEMAGDLKDYGSLDDDRWSALEDEEAQELWEILRLGGRIEACRHCRISIFAARREHYSEADDDMGSLSEYLRGC